MRDSATDLWALDEVHIPAVVLASRRNFKNSQKLSPLKRSGSRRQRERELPDLSGNYETHS